MLWMVIVDKTYRVIVLQKMFTIDIYIRDVRHFTCQYKYCTLSNIYI